MRRRVEEAGCGPYTLFALQTDTLFELPDGSLELFAEASYRIHLGTEAERDVLRGALDVLGNSDEGLLRFGNFIGKAQLGGRTLAVGSRRLSLAQVDAMLDDIEQRVGALPFAAATPVLTAYERDERRGPDVLYHAYAHLRDGDACGWSARSPGRHRTATRPAARTAQPRTASATTYRSCGPARSKRLP